VLPYAVSAVRTNERVEGYDLSLSAPLTY